MELDASWATMRESWEELNCPQSYYLDLFTPPLSPLDPPKQGTARNGLESDEDFHEPCTPSPHTYGSHRTRMYKDFRPTATIVGTDPFTPLNSPSPSPLFRLRTPIASQMHYNSRSSMLSCTETQISDQPELAILEERQSKKNGLLLFHSESLEALAVEAYSGCSTPPPPSTFRDAPLKINSFTKMQKIRHRITVSESQPTTAKNVNLDLLRCCALLQVKDPDCLKLADNALMVAQHARIQYLISKSQFYRGQCLFELKRYKEASDAFTRAASVRDWKGNVWKCKNAAERMLHTEAIMEENKKVPVLFDEDPDEYWDDYDRELRQQR
jgi:hypothetical protein